MSMQDPISDMLTRIRNAGMASLDEIVMPYSKLKGAIADVLNREGYIRYYKEVGEGAKKRLIIGIKYYNNRPVIEGIKRVSKPSCRIYSGSREIPKVRNSLGMAIVSTPKGVLCDREARKLNVGGEILCYVW